LQDLRRSLPLDRGVCEIKNRRDASIMSAALSSRAMSSGPGEDVNLISTAHSSFPKSNTK